MRRRRERGARDPRGASRRLGRPGRVPARRYARRRDRFLQARRVAAPMSEWTPALRIARRSVKRDLGRAVLVVALIGLPVSAAAMVDVVARTLSSPERQAKRDMGSADLTVFGA